MTDVRNLIFVLGDQLDPDASAFDGADPERDVVVMAEVEAEVRRYPNHKQRLALFFAAMRHFREALRARGFTVVYQQIGDAAAAESLPAFLARRIHREAPRPREVAERGD